MAAPTARVALAPGYTVSRLVKGGWQLAGGHGTVAAAAALADMQAFVDAGITTFDCADIYTGVEALIGDFVRRRGHARDLQIHTKYVPDLAALGALTAAEVARAIERSLTRLNVEALDLVQLHWWDYDRPGLVDTAGWLDDLRAAGKIRHLGVTNFSTPALQALLDAGLPIVSHQVQYSLLDTRPAGAMSELCAARGGQLLCYGALAGGFLSERYLGAADPAELSNRSLVKYRLIVDEYGGWAHFQRLLHAAAAVARRHATTIGAVAIAWVLEQRHVAGVIVGARDTRHLSHIAAAAGLVLDDADRRTLQAVLAEAPGVTGDIYDLERVKGGRHAAIMKYDLNAKAGAGG
ncbi:MAG TPA: aldo/keto reductase [Vicinamibacterales bacterium]|nr:aldo/keto reductase [Vicinamibacterales bacterium]